MKKLFSALFALIFAFTIAFGALASDGVMQPSDDFYVTDNAGTLSESTKELIDLAGVQRCADMRSHYKLPAQRL